MPWPGALEPRRVLASALLGGLLIWVWLADSASDQPGTLGLGSDRVLPEYRLIAERPRADPAPFGLAAVEPLRGRGYGLVGDETPAPTPYAVLAAEHGQAGPPTHDAALLARAEAGDPNGYAALAKRGERAAFAERRDATGQYRGS